MISATKLAFSALSFVIFLVEKESNCNAVESGTIIPLYIYPIDDNAWQRLFDAQSAYPINTWAIVNVNSGPGSSNDPNYQRNIPRLHAAGIKTLGYVRTDYGRINKDVVKAEIDQWKNLYNPNGIFFDEMAYEDDDTKVEYYREINEYAKSKGYIFTVGNPGTATVPKYFNTVDNIVTYERDVGFPSQDLICSQDTLGKGRDHVSILPYNIQNLDTAAVSQMRTCAGYIYVTDDGGNNPWDTLPHYLTQLFQTLRG